jgi:hypothetical protein
MPTEVTHAAPKVCFYNFKGPTSNPNVQVMKDTILINIETIKAGTKLNGLVFRL